MNYLRIFFFGAMAAASIFFGWDIFDEAFGPQRDVYVIDGILNYWAIFAGFLSSLVIITYCMTEILKKRASTAFLNKGVIISCALISPIISFALKEVTLYRASDYVQCDRLSKISTRFSSKTYAVNNDICVRLEEKKKS